MARFLTEDGRLPEHAGAPRRCRACRERRHPDGARGSAAIRPQPGRCLALHARGAQARARHAAALAPRSRRPRSRSVFAAYLPYAEPARAAHRRTASRLRDADRRSGLRGRAADGSPTSRAVARGRAGQGRARLRGARAAPAAATAGARAGDRGAVARREECWPDRALAGEPAGAVKTRIHGDYHLGQVLIVAERRHDRRLRGRAARARPRSGAARARRCATWPACCAPSPMRARPPRARSAQRFGRGRRRASTAAAASWQRAVETAFLDAYEEAAQGSPARVEDGATRERLLRLHLLAKALYEIDYEANNRPDWIETPIRGVLVDPRAQERPMANDGAEGWKATRRREPGKPTLARRLRPGKRSSSAPSANAPSRRSSRPSTATRSRSSVRMRSRPVSGRCAPCCRRRAPPR